MPTLTIRWITRDDKDVCDICRPLHGRSWTFVTAKDPFPRVLAHPLSGIVWDCEEDRPRTHGKDVHSCRCRLSWKIDDSDLVEQLKTVRIEMMTRLEELGVEL